MVEKLSGHHIFPWNEYPELRFDSRNGLTMCDDCHYCYHYADSENAYKFIKEVFEFRKLAELLTIEKLANLHEKLAELSTKVSSSDDTQKTKDTIQKKLLPAWLQTLQKLKHFKVENEWIEEMESTFADIDLEEAAREFVDYWSEQRRQVKSMKATFRNRLKQCRQWRRCLKPPPKGEWRMR